MRSYFIFEIYDVDGDKEISINDLIVLNNSIPSNSALGHELKLIYN